MSNRTVAISDARQNLTDLVGEIRFTRQFAVLTQRAQPRVTLLPAEFGPVVEALGGPDGAVEILIRAKDADA